MAEDKLFFHECRAAGWVFKDCDEWMKWLKENDGDIRKAVATHKHGGKCFQYTVNDACVNPNRIRYELPDNKMIYWEARTAYTQFGWIWGYGIATASGGGASPCSYPSRYDNLAIFYEHEQDAAKDALSFIINQMEGMPKSKAVSMLLYYAKKKRADIQHPQQELFK